MQTLAVKFRPKTFDDVVEQGPIKTILLKQLETKTHKNAYLFTGGAGTGKTTTARIFAKDLNGGAGLPIEIDAASNNGVENVREIIVNAGFKSMECTYKVYIIDECHMLSAGAWNAMLKLLEEPPAQTVFIFCTTDPQKIPGTILSRVQRYDFHRIKFESVVKRLQYIIKAENEEQSYGSNEDFYTWDDGALEFIAKIADGGMRDAITLLDKCLSYSTELTIENAVKALGTANYDILFGLVQAILDSSAEECVSIIENIHMSGVDLKLFMKQFGNFLLDLTKYYMFNDIKYVKIPSTFSEELDEFTDVNCVDLLEDITKLQSDIKWESEPKPIIQTRLILLCQS